MPDAPSLDDLKARVIRAHLQGATPSDATPPNPARTPGGEAESVAQAFRRGFGEGRGGGAPLGEAIRGGPIPLITQPIREAAADISGLYRGTQEALAASGPLGRDIAAMPEAFQGSPGGIVGAAPARGAVSEALFPGSNAAAARTSEQRLSTKAASTINRALGESVKGGQITAMDALDQMGAARQAGQPFTVSDLGGKPVERLAGTVYRAGGAPAAAMEKFYKGRGSEFTLDHLNTVAGARIERAIGENIASGSFRDASKNLIATRSERARPLWEEALAGGSTAPLEQQFGTAFNEAAAAERDSFQRLAQIKNEATQALGRQTTAGNVYSASGANRSAREIQQKFRAAEAELAEARKVGDEARQRLRQAQDDRSTEAPGAVWSPRLQQFLDDPEWKEGIRRGYRQERRDAVTENRRINPSEYAIVGIDENGDPIVGAVPTTKLLQVAREGRAAQIDDLRDPLTGGLTKEGRSKWRNLKAFEAEGYRLNPAWKTANDAWSGDTDSIRALQLGKKIFQIPYEDLVEDFRAMPENDKELFRLAAASKAVEDVKKTPFAADPSKRVLNNADELRRLRVLFDDDQRFVQFVQQINRERTMFATPVSVMRGSQTAERGMADVAAHALPLAYGVGNLLHNPISAAGHLYRGVRDIRRVLPNEKLNLEIARQLTDPKIALTAESSGALKVGLPPIPSYVPGASP
jgi:hypothetical protein